MKVFISSDIEGAAGIVDWEQVRGPAVEYEIGRQLLAGEVNAAIDGAVEAGASHVLVRFCLTPTTRPLCGRHASSELRSAKAD